MAPVNGSFMLHVLPGMLLLGLGAGIAFNPMLMAAMSDVTPEESGIASGMVNTAFMMGGSLGLAVLASLAAARTTALQASNVGMAEAISGGYQIAFVAGSVFAATAALIALLYLRREKTHAPARVHLV
jgi:MFS family permease